jgi:hypothetical protein
MIPRTVEHEKLAKLDIGYGLRNEIAFHVHDRSPLLTALFHTGQSCDASPI